MPALKSDVYLVVGAGGREFKIGGVRLVGKKYAIKRGRSWARKESMVTLTKMFDIARRWAVKQEADSKL